MPPKKSQYVLNFLARTKQLGSHIEVPTSNDMYALFGFMNDQSRVYKIFQRLRRKILFIVRLRLMMRRNHAQKELLKLAEAKRERASKSAEFSFFRLIKFRKLPRGWRLFFNRGGYRSVTEMTRCMKHECLNIAIRLASDAVLMSESRQHYAALIDELKKLFIDTTSLILIEHAPISPFAGENHLPSSDNGFGDPLPQNPTISVDPLTQNPTISSDLLTQNPTISSEAVEQCADDEIAFSISAISIILAFFRRLLVCTTKLCFQIDVASSPCDEQEEPRFTANSRSSILSNVNKVSDAVDDTCYTHDGANSASLPTAKQRHQDSSAHSRSAHSLTHMDHESCSSHHLSSSSDCSQAAFNDEIDAYMPTDEFQVFKDWLSYSNDFYSEEDVGQLVSDMIDCVCNSWINISPQQTPECAPDSGKELDATYTFQYNVPMLPIATSTIEHQLLKPCSWCFYMCVTFFTRIDLVQISAVHYDRELHLLSLSWIDFSRICLPCDSGVRVCLRFQGKFSSLIICQSRYDEIMKIRQVHAARKLASLVREDRIRDVKLFHLKQKCTSSVIHDCSKHSSNLARQGAPISDSIRRLSHHRRVFAIPAKSHASLIQLRAKGMLSSTRMPFLNLVKLLESAISDPCRGTQLKSGFLYDQHHNYVAPTHGYSLPNPGPLHTEHEYFPQHGTLPKPPMNALSPDDRKLRPQRIRTKLPSRPLITCCIPKVNELQLPNQEVSFPSKHIPHTPEVICQRENSFIATPCRSIESCIVNDEQFNSLENCSIAPRTSDSRESLSVRIPTAEKSDTASMMILFSPHPPSTIPSKMLSPRFVPQRELLHEFPINSQSPRQYIPHKLIARGRFKSTPIVHIPKQQQQASHVTISLPDSPSLVGVKLLINDSCHSMRNSELPMRLVNRSSNQTQLNQLVG